MTTWYKPPIAKIYEALTAVADERVIVIREGEAQVSSSDSAKTYTVTWNADRSAFGSNDNASYWQGYLGYPIIATLMKIGVLTYSPEVAARLSGVPWKKLNDAAKRKYDLVIQNLLDKMSPEHSEEVRSEAEHIKRQIDGLSLGKLAAASQPPLRR